MNSESFERRHFLRTAIPGLGLAALTVGNVASSGKPVASGEFNVRDFGAQGDGAAFDPQAIQAAIDACAKAGGGRVILQGGTFLTWTIQLKSNVTLFIEASAVLRISRSRTARSRAARSPPVRGLAGAASTVWRS